MQYSTLLLLLPAILAAPVDTVEEHEVVKRETGYWQGHCFGVALDHASVDQTHNNLKYWASNNPTITTTNHNLYEANQFNSVIAYACTDQHYQSNTFSSNDVQAAYHAMDLACPAYTSGYAVYVDTTDGLSLATSKIIGKDYVGHPVCQNSSG